MKKILFIAAVLLFHFVTVQAQEDTSLTQYKGVYNFAAGSPAPSIEITIVDGALYGATAAGAGAFTKMSRDTFSIPSYQGMAYFSRNAGGKVNGLRIVVGDTIMEGEKVPSGVALLDRKLWLKGKNLEYGTLL